MPCWPEWSWFPLSSAVGSWTNFHLSGVMLPSLPWGRWAQGWALITWPGFVCQRYPISRSGHLGTGLNPAGLPASAAARRWRWPLAPAYGCAGALVFLTAWSIFPSVTAGSWSPTSSFTLPRCSRCPFFRSSGSERRNFRTARLAGSMPSSIWVCWQRRPYWNPWPNA